jgi:hypothetical protein
MLNKKIMKKITIILSMFIAVLSSYAQNDETMKELTLVVNDIQSITQQDNGKFWNIKYATPLLFVNPENRQAFVFDMEKKPYIIQLSDTIPIANTSIYWNGKHWAMIGLPLPEHPYMYETLILHEMFHALQPQLGFDALYEMPCAHLEKEKGAVLLRLELQALLKALEQKDNKDSLYKHLTNALTFRNSRYAIYPKAKEEENAMELNEGMAQYTMFMMSQRYGKNKLDEKVLMTLFQRSVSFFEQNEQRSARSFAYETIPLYGYLIQMDIPNWHQKVTQKTNLTDYFMQIMNMNDTEEEIILAPQNNEQEIVIINLNNNDNNINIGGNEGMITFVLSNNDVDVNMDNEEWKPLAFQYDYENIAKEEHARFGQKNIEKDSIKQRFLCINRVEIPLFNYSYSFNPFNFMILDDIGVFYTETTIYDSWGKVEASSGLILDKENGKVILTPMIKRENNIITGDGWELHLNNGWKIEQKGEWIEVIEK